MAFKKRINGQMVYAPPAIVEELQSIQHDLGITRRAEAFEHMAKFSKFGRNTDKVWNLPKYLDVDVRRKKR